jgi:hypothetical protein
MNAAQGVSREEKRMNPIKRFWSSLSPEERQQIRQLFQFLGVVVVFIILASLTVGVLTGGLG